MGDSPAGVSGQLYKHRSTCAALAHEHKRTFTPVRNVLCDVLPDDTCPSVTRERRKSGRNEG